MLARGTHLPINYRGTFSKPIRIIINRYMGIEIYISHHEPHEYPKFLHISWAQYYVTVQFSGGGVSISAAT